MTIKEIQEIIQSKSAILVYFQNDHCPPCMSLRPKVETLISQQFDKMDLLFVDSFANPELTANFSIFAHPTLLIFFEGKEYFRASKYISTQELSTKIKRPYELIFDA